MFCMCADLGRVGLGASGQRCVVMVSMWGVLFGGQAAVLGLHAAEHDG